MNNSILFFVLLVSIVISMTTTTTLIEANDIGGSSSGCDPQMGCSGSSSSAASSSSSSSAASSSSSSASSSGGSGGGGTSGSSSSSFGGGGSSSGSYYEPYALPEVFTSFDDTSLTNLSNVQGNTYNPQLYTDSCGRGVVKTFTDECLNEVTACLDKDRRTGVRDSNTSCSLIISTGSSVGENLQVVLTSCMTNYAQCLANSFQNITTTQYVDLSVCSWPVAFDSEIFTILQSGIASFDLDIFAFQAARLHFSCVADAFAVAQEVGALMQTTAFEFVPDTLKGVGLSNTGGALPVGLAQVVIRSRGNCSSPSCTRKHSSGSCSCPSGTAQSFDGYAPSYLTASKTDTCKRAASIYEFCKEDSSSTSSDPLENVSFILRDTSNDTTSSSSSSSRRATTSTTETTCSSSSQTPRRFKILAPNASDEPEVQTLTVCAPPSTNVFILNSKNGSCYNPREDDNISCSCDNDNRKNAFNLVYINQTTNESQSGSLVICNKAVSSSTTAQQIASASLTAFTALLGGPNFLVMQIASVVTLIDCKPRNDLTGEVRTQGGRKVIIPFELNVDSPAAGLYFALIVIFGALIFQGFIVLIAALIRFACDKPVEKDPRSADQIFFSRNKPEWHRKTKEELEEEQNNNNDDNDDEGEVRVQTAEHEEEEELQQKQQQSSGDTPTSIVPPTKEQQQEEETTDVEKEGMMMMKHLDEENFNREASPREEAIVVTETFSPSKDVDAAKTDKTIVFTVTGENGEKIQVRLPHVVQYEDDPDFWTHLNWIAGKLRFPHLSLFLCRILFQGLSYESVYLMTRFGGELRAIGIISFFLSLGLFAWYCYQGYEAHKLYRSEAFYEYRLGYLNSFSVVRFLGFRGMWNQRFAAVRQGSVFFGNFRGDSPHLWWSVPLPLMKALLVSIIAGVPVSEDACDFVYYFLAVVLLLVAVLQTYARAERSMIDVITNMFLNIIVAVLLLMIVNEASSGIDVVYLLIVYGATSLACISIGFIIHEVCFVLPREMAQYLPDDGDADVSDDDDESDHEDDQDHHHQQNPLSADGEEGQQEQEERRRRQEEREAARAERRFLRRREKAARRSGLSGYLNYFASLF